MKVKTRRTAMIWETLTRDHLLTTRKLRKKTSSHHLLWSRKQTQTRQWASIISSFHRLTVRDMPPKLCLVKDIRRGDTIGEMKNKKRLAQKSRRTQTNASLMMMMISKSSTSPACWFKSGRLSRLRRESKVWWICCAVTWRTWPSRTSFILRPLAIKPSNRTVPLYLRSKS